MADLELHRDGDLTVIGAARNLLDLIAQTTIPGIPVETADAIEEACDRLVAAINGPDWTTMAEQLVGPPSDLRSVVDKLLARMDHVDDPDEEEGEAPVYELTPGDFDDLSTALYREDDNRARIVAQVAAGLAAAHEDGQLARPLERIIRLDVTPQTVLCFPIPDDMLQVKVAAMSRGLRSLAARIEAAVGFPVQVMAVPTSSIPTALEGKPPEAVRVQVSVAAPLGSWRVVLADSPTGWQVETMTSPMGVVFRGAAMTPAHEAIAKMAVELAVEGHGARL